MSKDFSEFAESFFSSYFNSGYVGIKNDNSTGLYALNNDDYTEHTHAVSEWIIEKVIKRNVPFMSQEEFLSFEKNVKDINQKTKIVDFWKIRDDNSETGWDKEYGFIRINNNDELLRVQYFNWDILFKPLSYFK